ncbi:hypothetical protein MMC07_002287 [Pseudocyphellaria aurata]|nr:hypothetical protein [Pseudocyphellaria aurata]
MFTSISFILVLFWTIAFPLCIAQVDHENRLYARKGNGRICQWRLDDVSTFQAVAPLDVLPDSFDAESFVFPENPRDAHNMAWVRNTLALYPLCVDGKDFESLNRVFTIDAQTNMSMSRPIIPTLPLLQKTLKNDFKGLRTHHQLGQESIKFFNHHCQAHTVTYFTATISDTRNGSTKVYYEPHPFSQASSSEPASRAN